jgi:hypothetical protein
MGKQFFLSVKYGCLSHCLIKIAPLRAKYDCHGENLPSVRIMVLTKQGSLIL